MCILLGALIVNASINMSPLNKIFRHPKAGDVLCFICKEPVSLETSKTDEYGHAAHEDCYIHTICTPTPDRPKKAA